MTGKEELTQLVEDISDDEAILLLCVAMFLDSMEKRADKATYYADADRRDLLKALFTATGATENSELAKHFLSFADGFDAGIGLRDKLDKIAG